MLKIALVLFGFSMFFLWLIFGCANTDDICKKYENWPIKNSPKCVERNK